MKEFHPVLTKSCKLLIAIWIGLSTAPIFAQGVYNSGATIYLDQGAKLFIPGTSGHFQNVNGGEVNNDGTIKLQGNWTNNVSNNVFINSNSTGTVHFTGDSTQTISGSEETHFENLVVNNSSANDAVILENSIEITDTLNLVDGVVTTNTNRLIHSHTSSGSLVSYGEGNFINGSYRKYITQNTETYVFPVGKGNTSADYFKAELINSNLKDVAYLNVSVSGLTETGNNVDGNLSTTQGGMAATNVKETAVWNITPDAIPTAGFYGINLYVKNFNGLTDNDFFTVKRPNGSSDYADWTTEEQSTTIPGANLDGRIVNSGNGFAQRLDLSSFSEFAIALFGEAGPTADSLIFYTSFSPNGDGANDVWRIRNIENYPEASVRIYNRWGRTVYFVEDSYFGKEWDGSSQDDDKVLSGAFYYLVDLNNGSDTYTGTITIIK